MRTCIVSRLIVSFNSKLVRLEVIRAKCLNKSILFQFQTGAIRSEEVPTDVINEIMFQFQTGSIRRT